MDNVYTLDHSEEITNDAGTFRLRIDQDPDGANPREDSDMHMGSIVAWVRRYDLPREGDHVQMLQALWESHAGDGSFYRIASRWLRMFHGAVVTLPIYTTGEANLTARTAPDDGDNAVGIIYVTRERLAELGALDSPPDIVANALRGEVECYDAWANGEMTSYVIEARDDDPEADDVWVETDVACGGYFGVADALQSGAEELAGMAEEALAEHMNRLYDDAMDEEEIRDMAAVELNGAAS